MTSGRGGISGTRFGSEGERKGHRHRGRVAGNDLSESLGSTVETRRSADADAGEHDHQREGGLR